MEYIELINERHSVRRFNGEPVERAIIDEMIEEARLAPSSKNCKSTGYMIVEDPSLLEAISEMRDRGSAFVKNAAAAIIVLGDTSKSDIWVENCAISSTYLMLSAVEHGLGSCWVHVRERLHDSTDPSKGNAEDYLRELLGIKDNMSVLCVIALGYEAIEE